MRKGLKELFIDMAMIAMLSLTVFYIWSRYETTKVRHPEVLQGSSGILHGVPASP